MAITDATNTNLTSEVRIRQGAHFQQVPNLIEAGEELANGEFVHLSTIDGKYMLAGPGDRATHCVLKSGEHRITATEIATLSGTVQEGETVMAFTGGPGTVTIPFATHVWAGDQLTINADGYAIQKPPGGGFVIGTAVNDVDLAGESVQFGEAFINLPAQWTAT